MTSGLGIGLGVATVALIVLGAFFGMYYENTTSTASLMGTQISSLDSRISYIEAHPSTSTIYSTETVTTTSTSVTTSTTTAYPIPDNVTVLFENSGSIFNYGINAATLSYSGSSSNTSIEIPITPVYIGEHISITATCGGTCPSGMTFSAMLYMNGSIVSQSSGNAFTGLSTSYTL